MIHTPLKFHKHNHILSFPWHPSVQYVEQGWNNHKWWMALTPYPPFNIEPYVDRYELPSIFYSDNGKEWFPITDNPIDNLTDEQVEEHDYLSDSHIVLVNGVLECYYRLSFLLNKQFEGNKTVLIRKTSVDGNTWSSRTIIADLRKKEDIEIWGDQIISPAIVYHDSDYYCWYVDRSMSSNNRKICRTSSADGINWTKKEFCKLPEGTVDPWHIDVQYYKGKYQLLVFDCNQIAWFESTDGITFRYVSKVLGPTKNTFYSSGLYRACLVLIDDTYYVFFSAKSKRKTAVGLLSSKDRITFRIENGIGRFEYIVQYLLLNHNFKAIHTIGKRVIKKALLRKNEN